MNENDPQSMHYCLAVRDRQLLLNASQRRRSVQRKQSHNQSDRNNKQLPWWRVSAQGNRDGDRESSHADSEPIACRACKALGKDNKSAKNIDVDQAMRMAPIDTNPGKLSDACRYRDAAVKMGTMFYSADHFVISAIDWLSQHYGDLHVEFHTDTGWQVSTCHDEGKWGEDGWIAGDGSLKSALLRCVELTPLSSEGR